jgi:hypothetical protein
VLRRVLIRAALAVAVAACLAVAGCSDDEGTPATGPNAERSSAAPAIRVHHGPGGARLVTRNGRSVLLRGASVSTLLDYHDRTPTPLDAGDYRQMAGMGLNVVRLAFNWGRVMPEPGRLDDGYLAELERHARWAAEAGLYVIVDSHQDRYAAGLSPDESDGAPRWAVQTDGASCAEPQPGGYTTCAARAAGAFFSNRDVAGRGLQDWYADALIAASRAVRDNERVIGLELYNEPVDTSAMPPGEFERERLWPFYGDLIDRLRGDGERRLILFQGQATRTHTDADPVAERFSDDPQLVYAPHVYTDVFRPGFPGAGLRRRLEQSYRAARREADAYHAALLIGEWSGAVGGPFEPYRRWNLDIQDELAVGSLVWQWTQPDEGYGWRVVTPDGRPLPGSSIAADMSRPHAITVPGRLVAQALRGDALQLVVDAPEHGGTARVWNGRRAVSVRVPAGDRRATLRVPLG